MIGILVLSHGEMAHGMIHSLNFLYGQAEGLRALCLYPEHSPADFDAMLAEAVEEVNQGDGVLIFTDINGGTPANRALMLAAQRPDVEVIAGMNLPLLLAAVSSREFCTLPELVSELLEEAKLSIACTSHALREQLAADSDDMDDLME